MRIIEGDGVGIIEGGHEAPPKWMEMVPHYLFASTSRLRMDI